METTEVMPIEVKTAIQKLAEALHIETSTKENIEALAESVAEEIRDPVRAIVALKPVMDFTSKLREKLMPDALRIAQEMNKEERRIGNLTYDVRSKKTFKYSEDPMCADLSAELKSRQAVVKEKEVVSHSVTEYIQVDIPKT